MALGAADASKISLQEESVESRRNSLIAIFPPEELQQIEERNEPFFKKIKHWLGKLIIAERRLRTDTWGFESALAQKYVIVTCSDTEGAYESLTNFISENAAFFKMLEGHLIGPANISDQLEKCTNIKFAHKVEAARLGGAMELGDLICRNRVKAAFVFRDRYSDFSRTFESMLRVADLYAVAFASCPSSAEALVHCDLFSGSR